MTIQQVKKERKETEKKDRNTILKYLFRQRSESVGSIDILNKRKGEEEDRQEAERNLLKKFEKNKKSNQNSTKEENNRI